MRQIPVIKYEDGQTSMLLYQNALSIPQGKGDYDEMAIVAPILSKVAGANGTLFLTEHEWEELCDRLIKVKFQQMTIIAYEAVKAALNAEECDAD